MNMLKEHLCEFHQYLNIREKNSSCGPNLFEIPKPSLVLFTTPETLNSSVIEYVLYEIGLHCCAAG